MLEARARISKLCRLTETPEIIIPSNLKSETRDSKHNHYGLLDPKDPYKDPIKGRLRYP